MPYLGLDKPIGLKVHLLGEYAQSLLQICCPNNTGETPWTPSTQGSETAFLGSCTGSGEGQRGRWFHGCTSEHGVVIVQLIFRSLLPALEETSLAQ